MSTSSPSMMSAQPSSTPSSLLPNYCSRNVIGWLSFDSSSNAAVSGSCCPVWALQGGLRRQLAQLNSKDRSREYAQLGGWTQAKCSAFVLFHAGHVGDLSVCRRPSRLHAVRSQGRYRLARLADKYGANCTLKELLELLAGDCKYRGRQRHPIRPGCGARFKDLEGSDRPPPDMPPTKLRIVAKGVNHGGLDLLRSAPVRSR